MKIKFSKETKELTLIEKLKKLFEYSDRIIGMYLDRESTIAYGFFQNPSSVKMIDKLNKGMKREKIKKNIENISWDFTIPRFIEIYLSINDKENFFIPYILTNDKNLREVLSKYKLKGIVYHSKKIEWYAFSDVEYNRFLESLEATNIHFDFFKSYLSENNKNIRRNRFEENKNNSFSILAREFEELFNVMECL